jgi:CPA2 family monovalent cation:H+ antiporter-2
MTLFFGSIGMLGDPEWILAHLPLVLGVVFAIVLFKTLLTTLSLRMVRAPLPAALAAGVSLAQIGEFSFVIAEMSRGVLLDHETFQLVVSVTIVTLALTPYLISFGPWLAARMRTRRSSVSDASAAVIEGHVVVVGYGPTGEAVVRRLEDVGFSVHVVDLNRGLVDRAALDGHTAHVGDAAHPEVLEHAGVNRAIAVVATLPDPDGSRRCVEQVRALVPCARLFVRAPYHRHRSSLLQAGAEAVVDEEEQVGRALAHVVAEALQPSGETGGDSLGGEPESSPVPNEGP